MKNIDFIIKALISEEAKFDYTRECSIGFPFMVGMDFFVLMRDKQDNFSLNFMVNDLILKVPDNYKEDLIKVIEKIIDTTYGKEDKITITVTKKGWETKVELEGETYIQKHENTISGSKQTEGNFEDNNAISDKLFYALTTFAQYDLMEALRNNNYEKNS